MNSKKRLIAKIRSEFPEAEFKKAVLVTKGWDHSVLVLDDRFIFRFAKEKPNKKTFSREVQFLREFSKISNLRVPNYFFLSKDKTFGGYEMIKGRELSRRIYKNLSANKRFQLIEGLAKFLSILHRIPVNKAQHYGFTRYQTWDQTLKGKQKWFAREFVPKVSPKLTPTQNDFIRSFVNTFYKSQYSVRPVLGHFDLSHDHVIMKRDGTISGIIDFGDLSISDPAREFNGFVDFDENLPKLIYKYYKGPKDPNFLKRCKGHYIHRWIYLLYDGLVRRKDKALWLQANREIDKIIRLETESNR